MKTVSLSLAIQLKEAGYPQESYFVFSDIEGIGIDLLKRSTGIFEFGNVIASSPTADEILDLLPEYSVELFRTDRNYACRYTFDLVLFAEVNLDEKNKVNKQMLFEEYSLADAAAKMWLYLKKEGLESHNGHLRRRNI